jgi:glycerol kinase
VTILVIDIGTSGVRAAAVDQNLTVQHESRMPLTPDTPFPGIVEFDAARLADAILGTANTILDWVGAVDAVGVANQRASTIVWDATTGEPVAPAIGWQDLRTVGECLVWQGEGLRLTPNQSATKLVSILSGVEPDRDVRFGTVDSWATWVLSEGSSHITDLSNAGVTGLVDLEGWDESILSTLGISPEVLPEIVDSTGELAYATALPGAPPLASLIGDQQSSLIGQGCVQPGLAKITFGTGGMLDVCLGSDPPPSLRRSEHGCFPIAAWRADGEATWGIEAMMLAAGTNVDWLHTDIGIIDNPAHSHEVAAACADSDGVVYVPAPLGLGTPNWDFGARGTLLGLTRGSDRSHITRAVLEGVAQRGADLVEAAEADTGLEFGSLRVDGGMSDNPTFVQALADATGRSVELAPIPECTTLGAAALAGLQIGWWNSFDEIAETWKPRAVVDPAGPGNRDRWQEALSRAGGWFEELSALDF